MKWYPTIAFTDFEFSGLDPLKHEILELGVIVADSQTLEERDRLNLKIKPEHIRESDPASLAFNGYKEELWADATPLKNALEQYFTLVGGSIFAAWKAYFDWAFLIRACQNANVKNVFDHHTIDVFTIAHEHFKHTQDLDNVKLSHVCSALGVPKEPMPHRAINGAETVYNIYKRMQTSQ